MRNLWVRAGAFVRGFGARTAALVVGGSVAFAGVVPAHAALDVTAVVTSLGDMGTALATVGAAIIAAAAIAIAYKWIKGMLFG